MPDPGAPDAVGTDVGRSGLPYPMPLLGELERTLQPLDDPEEIMRVVARMVGEYLHVDRCAYAEAEADENHVTITGSYAGGLPPLSGRLAVADFGADVLHALRTGEVYVLDDAATDPRLLPAERAVFAEVGIAAMIATPLRKAGRFVAAMALHHATPRHWTAEEIALLDAVVARSWESLNRAHAHAALREGEERYRRIAERANDGIWLADAEGHYLDVNPAACAMLGYTREEHLRLTFDDLIRDEDRDRMPPLLAALFRGESRTEVWDLRRKDGTTVPIELSLQLEAGQRMQSIGRDVTERRRVERERDGLLERERETNRQLRLLQRATAALSAAATSEAVAATTVEQVGELVPGSAVGVWEQAGPGALRALAHAGWTDDKEPLSTTRPGPIPGAFFTGEARWILEGEWPAVEEVLRTRDALEERGFGSLGCIPLVTDETLGLLTLAMPAGSPPTAGERATAETLAEQCAQALHRARLLEAEREIAAVVQRSLLPRELPALDRLAAAARYLPSASHLQAGGDWYDLISVDPTTVALVIGDVVGQGPAAAAVMGQLRSALAGALLDGHSPAAALERLDRFATRVPGSVGSTCACLLHDWATGELRWASAGHPPVLLLDPDDPGSPRLLDGGRGPVLGARTRRPYREAHARIGAGTSLVLYTDGLVENRGEVLDEGLARLVDTARDAADLGPDALANRLVTTLLPGPGPADDVAVLAVRAVPEPLSEQRQAVPEALRPMRRSVARWAEAAGLALEVVDDLQLALGEAAANAVEHAYAGKPGQWELSVARASDGAVEVAVRDHGRWRPVPEDSGFRGHGLRVLRELTEDLAITRGPNGTRVAFRIPGPSRTESAAPAAPAPPDGTTVTSAPDGTPLVILSGEVDLARRNGIAAQLLPAVRGQVAAIDLSAVTYLSSAGIALLGEAAAVATRLSVRVVPGSAPARAVEISGLEEALNLLSP